MIADLGLLDSLVGVSEECRWPPDVVGKPIVTAAQLDPSQLTSLEIDAAVRASVRDGRSLYSVDAELIDALAPDLIVTQDLCTVCAVSSSQLVPVSPVAADTLSLDPRTLGGVADSVRTLAATLGVIDRGEQIVAEMWQAIDAAAEAVRGLPTRRVFFAEWIEPPFCAGHWLPEMIGLAGGEDVLGRAGQPSHATTWREMNALEPELIVLGACGFGAEETAERAARLEFPCPAIAVDGDSYYSRPAPRLADGVRQLAHLFHPETAPDPGLPAIGVGVVTA
jgi:iron complex transport system substrate-binding protein